MSAGSEAVLRECPGCGDTRTRVIGGPGTQGGPKYWTGCDLCRWRTWGDTEADAITAWNERATPPATIPVEALEGLAAEWEAEAAALLGKSKRAANHVAAGGLNTRAAQLRKLIKERSNG